MPISTKQVWNCSSNQNVTRTRKIGLYRILHTTIDHKNSNGRCQYMPTSIAGLLAESTLVLTWCPHAWLDSVFEEYFYAYQICSMEKVLERRKKRQQSQQSHVAVRFDQWTKWFKQLFLDIRVSAVNWDENVKGCGAHPILHPAITYYVCTL